MNEDSFNPSYPEVWEEIIIEEVDEFEEVVSVPELIITPENNLEDNEGNFVKNQKSDV